MVKSSQYQLKDTFIESESERIIVSGTVSANNEETTTVTADNGEIWSVIAVGAFVPSDADATQNSHRVRFGPNSFPTRSLFAIEAAFDTNIDLTSKRVKSGQFVGTRYSFAETQQKCSDVLIDDTNGVEFTYENNTDAAQENNREYKLIVNKFEA